MEYLFEDVVSVSNECAVTLTEEIRALDAEIEFNVHQADVKERLLRDGTLALPGLEQIEELFLATATESEGGMTETGAQALRIGFNHICANVHYPNYKDLLPSQERFADVNDRVDASLEAGEKAKEVATNVMNAVRNAIKKLFGKIKVAIVNLIARGAKYKEKAEALAKLVSEHSKAGLADKGTKIKDSTLATAFSEEKVNRSVDKAVVLLSAVSKKIGDAKSAISDLPKTDGVEKWARTMVATANLSRDTKSKNDKTDDYKGPVYVGKTIVMSITKAYEPGTSTSLATAAIVPATDMKQVEEMDPLGMSGMATVFTAIAAVNFDDAKKINVTVGAMQSDIDKAIGDVIALARGKGGDNVKKDVASVKHAANAVSTILNVFSLKLLLLVSKVVKYAFLVCKKSVDLHDLDNPTKGMFAKWFGSDDK